jgi:hypothetical protein
MRTHSEDKAIEIVASLIETEMANKNTRITSIIRNLGRLWGEDSCVATMYIYRQLVLPGRRHGFRIES